jgi:hypothetical protein
VAADFDGTLRSRTGGITARDLATLRRLGEEGVLRVIATGRSPYSFYSVVDAHFPADYLAFSSGAGVLEIGSGRVLRHLAFTQAQALELTRLLARRDADFMLHLPMPLNHHFYYRTSRNPAPDFRRRLELYRRFAHPLPAAPSGSSGDPEGAEATGAAGASLLRRGATQIVAIFPPESPEADTAAEEAAGTAGVIRATSPLDGRSSWVELFPPGTDKGSALAWIAGEAGIEPARCMGIGNDYNDLHLLEWCGSPYVVANAPRELRERYPAVAACGESGFSEAVDLWRAGAEGGKR